MLAMCEALGIECIDWPVQDEHARARIAGGAAGSSTASREPECSGALRPPLSDIVAAHERRPRGRRSPSTSPAASVTDTRAGSPAVQAALTLTMGLPKLCLYLPRARALCGRIFVIPVGFPAALIEDPAIPGELLSAPARGAAGTAHSRRYVQEQSAAISRSSPASIGTTGAAWLCASAAARSRLGLVTLFIDTRSVPASLAQKLTSVMCRPWAPPREAEKAAWDPSGTRVSWSDPGGG